MTWHYITLHYIALYYITLHYITAGELEVATALIDAGCDVEATTAYGDTAATKALKYGHLAIVARISERQVM